MGYAAAALAFPMLVLRGAQNPLTERQLGGIYARSSAMYRGRPGEETVEVLGANHQDHAALLDALRRKSEGDAEALARKHVLRLMAAALGGTGQSDAAQPLADEVPWTGTGATASTERVAADREAISRQSISARENPSTGQLVPSQPRRTKTELAVSDASTPVN